MSSNLFKKIKDMKEKNKERIIPAQLKNLSFCRVKQGTKVPFEKDWTNKPYTYNEIQKFQGENYGVLCGLSNLAVVDCDKEELTLAVSQLFPETFSVKTGGGGTHFYYFIPELKKKIILNAGEEHLGEIQSYGTQVVGVGSVHPNGNKYEGDFSNGLIEGQGKLTAYNGDKYFGELKNGKFHGHGVMKSQSGDIIYDGLWINGEKTNKYY